MNNEDGVRNTRRQRLLSIDDEEEKKENDEGDEGKMDEIDDVGEGDDSIDDGAFH